MKALTSRKINILDVTIRDGSYVNKFSFKPEDVANIVKKLSDAGVGYIEASHGLGIGSAKMGVPGSASDEEYAAAAASSKGRARIGAIGHHKWTTKDELKKLAKYLDFFRIVTNANEPDPIRPYIDFCHDLGMKIMIQFSRSSQVSKEVLAKSAQKAGKWGADIVYIVDTSGSFIPEEVKSYVQAVKKRTNVTLGFHGHNSLNMAVANTVLAIASGCTFVDASLLGIGRDSGNACTASLLAVLKRHKIQTSISMQNILTAGDELAKPILDATAHPKWYSLYLAHKKRDFWPYSILEFIAKECEKTVWETLEAYTNIPNVVEAEAKDIEELILKLGKNPARVLKKLSEVKDIF